MQQGKSGNFKVGLEIQKGAEPFISGTFEYGLGRVAAGRKVYLFINKAQDHMKLHDAMVQFLGVYKTNKKVISPPLLGLPPYRLQYLSNPSLRVAETSLNRAFRVHVWHVTWSPGNVLSCKSSSSVDETLCTLTVNRPFFT